MSHDESTYTRLDGSRAVEIPDSEVILKPKRRQYSAEYKLRILQEYEACTEPGGRGALLRREGLYSSHITAWRRQRDQTGLCGLAGQKRGPKVDPEAAEVARLERENERLRQRLQRAELIIDVQKNVSQLLGLPLAEIEEESIP
jgi:transposase